MVMKTTQKSEKVLCNNNQGTCNTKTLSERKKSMWHTIVDFEGLKIRTNTFQDANFMEKSIRQSVLCFIQFDDTVTAGAVGSDSSFIFVLFSALSGD